MVCKLDFNSREFQKQIFFKIIELVCVIFKNFFSIYFY